MYVEEISEREWIPCSWAIREGHSLCPSNACAFALSLVLLQVELQRVFVFAVCRLGVELQLLTNGVAAFEGIEKAGLV